MRARFSVAAIQALKQDLDAMPEVDPDLREISLGDAIRALAPAIRKLQSRGYSKPRILELLKERGISATETTLKHHMSQPAPRTRDSKRGSSSSVAKPAASSRPPAPPAVANEVPKGVPRVPSSPASPSSAQGRPPGASKATSPSP
jgi:hypothetical protein